MLSAAMRRRRAPRLRSVPATVPATIPAAIPAAVSARGRRTVLAALACLSVLGTACASTPAPAVARGQELYAANCIGCHGGAQGGEISDIPPRHNARGHTWHHGDCVLSSIIRTGTDRRPGLPADAPTMPPFGDTLDRDDIVAVLAYIRTWWTPEQRAQQAESTAQDCATPAPSE